MRNDLTILRLVSSSNARSVASHSDLIRVEAPADELEIVATGIMAIRGVHRVEVRWNSGKTVKAADGSYTYVDSDWRTVVVYGTERAIQGARNMLMHSGLVESDRNADHDHARCVEFARSQGVPAEWAHRVETYLSM